MYDIICKTFLKNFENTLCQVLSSFEQRFYSFYLYALWAITFISVTLFFGQSLRVNILKSGSGLPMPLFIDVFVLEQRLQKIMVWKDLIFVYFFPFYYLLHVKA